MIFLTICSWIGYGLQSGSDEGPEITTKIPYFPYLGFKFGLFLSRDIENCGDFDSEISMMTVALLANSRALHAVRTANFSLFVCAFN